MDMLEQTAVQSSRVLAEMQLKKEVYFGKTPETSTGTSGYFGTDNGFLNAMELQINILREHLTQISEIISLF